MVVNHKHQKLSEDGFAPIIVSIIIIIVLSLLTIGFVTLVNNNQENALNRQLNNAAYYAAETGVNDAVAAINNGYNQVKSSCGEDASNPYLKDNQVNGPGDYYSCLLINPTPSSLQYSSIDSYEPTVSVLSTTNPNTNSPENPTTLVFSWQPSAQVENSPYQFAPDSWFPDCFNANGPCFPPEDQWASNNQPITGVLRLALTPLYDQAPLPTDTSTTYTAFLYPVTTSSSGDSDTVYGPSTIGANSGEEIGGACSNSQSPDACKVSVDVSSASTSGFLMSLSSIYDDSQVTIEAFNGSTQLNFQNAQTLIDSTGDDQGVLKRIQVRVASLNDTGFPGYDIASSTAICKDLKSYPTNQSTGEPGETTSSCGL